MSAPQPPYWDGSRWLQWNGSQWMTWTGQGWSPAAYPQQTVTSPPISPGPAPADPNGSGVSPPSPPTGSGGGAKTLFVVIGLLVLFGLATWAVGAFTSGVGKTLDSVGQERKTIVTYEVSGSSDDAAMITYITATGMEQTNHIPPWTQSLTFPSGAFVSVSAQNGGEFGSVTCRISVNGTTLSSNTTDADYGVVDCSGALP